MEKRIDFKVYDAAVAADDAFQTALVAVYGEKRAADARYQSNHDSVVVIAARAEKIAADAAWRVAQSSVA